MTDTDFAPWPKTPRLNRDIIITEKIDGTNAQVLVRKIVLGISAADSVLDAVVENEDGVFAIRAGSRKRWVCPDDDNFGFAGWVHKNAAELVRALGEGRHYGEWWGQGIQRGYGLDHRVFSLFNTHRWRGAYADLALAQLSDGLLDVVPELYQGPFDTGQIQVELNELDAYGSAAAFTHSASEPQPAEGVIVYHTAARQCFKVLIENDDQPKGLPLHVVDLTERIHRAYGPLGLTVSLAT